MSGAPPMLRVRFREEWEAYCSKCGEWLPLAEPGEFWQPRASMARCMTCIAEWKNAYEARRRQSPERREAQRLYAARRRGELTEAERRILAEKSREANRRHSRKSYAKNKDQWKAHRRAYYEAHAEEIKAKAREYRARKKLAAFAPLRSMAA